MDSDPWRAIRWMAWWMASARAKKEKLWENWVNKTIVSQLVCTVCYCERAGALKNSSARSQNGGMLLQVILSLWRMRFQWQYEHLVFRGCLQRSQVFWHIVKAQREQEEGRFHKQSQHPFSQAVKCGFDQFVWRAVLRNPWHRLKWCWFNIKHVFACSRPRWSRVLQTRC